VLFHLTECREGMITATEINSNRPTEKKVAATARAKSSD